MKVLEFVVKRLLMPSRNSKRIAINWIVFSHTTYSCSILFYSMPCLVVFTAYCMLLFFKLDASYLIGLTVWEDTFVGPIRALPGTDGTLGSPGRRLGLIWVLKKRNAYCGVGKNNTPGVCRNLRDYPPGLNKWTINKSAFWVNISG